MYFRTNTFRALSEKRRLLYCAWLILENEIQNQTTNSPLSLGRRNNPDEEKAQPGFLVISLVITEKLSP